MAENLIGACVFGQSGGPTAVINSSAYGVIRAALDNPSITKVYGSSYGVTGILNDKLYIMDEEDPAELELLKNTPSSELGSCRYKLKNPEDDDTDYKRIVEIFRKYNVRYFFYNGGNDSMDTCSKVSRYLASVGYECNVIGVPKTIDNDLMLTDHCPGFPSAAKFIATSCMELKKDAAVYGKKSILVIEIMGRDAGWLTASSAIAATKGWGPDLIYLPETNFVMEDFLADIDALTKKQDCVMIAVSEGIHYADGSLVVNAQTSATDGFGHVQLGGLASYLERVIKEHTGMKCRGIELNLLQRCAAHIASLTDIEEAVTAGNRAVEAAVAGETGKMVAYTREYVDGKYKCGFQLVNLSDVANYVKTIPAEWINEKHNGVTQELVDYVMPLIQGEPERIYEDSLPRYPRLKKVIETA